MDRAVLILISQIDCQVGDFKVDNASTVPTFNSGNI